MTKTKTIKISEESHKLLEDYGKKGETFDDIIKRIVKRYNQEKGTFEQYH